MTDILIAGAGPAGLTAALVLARAGRAVVVLDGGPGRNAPTAHAYNVFTRDGTSPDELRAVGRQQAEAYGARFVATEATHAHADDAGVRVTLADGTEIAARRLLLATGVVDDLPPIPGVAEAWGETVAHCPYCHGFELKGRPTAVLASGEMAVEFARTLTGWTDRLTVVSNGPAGLTDEQKTALDALGIAVDERPVARLDVDGRAVQAVVFEDGGRLAVTAVYVKPPQRLRGSLPRVLGLALSEAGLVQTDPAGRTSVPTVWACGDMTTPMQAVQMAATAGFGAAAMLNHDLITVGVRYAGADL